MTTIKIELGEYQHITKHFEPGVYITIEGDHALAQEVLAHLEKFESPNIQIDIR